MSSLKTMCIYTVFVYRNTGDAGMFDGSTTLYFSERPRLTFRQNYI